MDWTQPQFWVAVVQIIAIDVVLGGDNAVVIALACRNLPPRLRNRGIFWGVFGAIALRTALIFFAITLLAIPFLKVLGGALLLWIGVKLLKTDSGSGTEGGAHVRAGANLPDAIRTIIVADAVMSLDNVVAIAGASRDSIGLVIFGLLVSVPIIVWGSKLVMALMERYPVIVVAGAALLGWIAGEMTVSDAALKPWVDTKFPLLHWLAPIGGAAFVVLLGKWLQARSELAGAAPVIKTHSEGRGSEHERSS
jgi:YjbE family integral membrane protein